MNDSAPARSGTISESQAFFHAEGRHRDRHNATTRRDANARMSDRDVVRCTINAPNYRRSWKYVYLHRTSINID